jgi:hypothetical protein
MLVEVEELWVLVVKVVKVAMKIVIGVKMEKEEALV